MVWNHVHGHDAIAERFRQSVRAGRLASTFLFVGPPGVGKRTFATALAQALLCETIPEIELDACGTCPSCQQVKARTHPDLLTVAKPDDKSFIPLESLIGDAEHRMQEGLCHDISLKPFKGGRKIAILDDADYLNQEGANCLLKTLEEPPPKSLIILIGTSEQRQLPTIRSRTQIVRFQSLTKEMIRELLLRESIVDDAIEAEQLAELSGGSLQYAVELQLPEVREFRAAWLDYLSSASSNPFAFTKDVTNFVDGAGKEAGPRRFRMKQLANWGTEFYRQVISELEGYPPSADKALQGAVSAAVKWIPSSETAALCLERCLDAHSQVEANANPATFLECWLDDLSNLSRGVVLSPNT